MKPGEIYGRLTMIARSGSDRHRKSLWLCRCACGTEIVTGGSSLVSGNTRSCGCLHREGLRARNLKHGQAVRKRFTHEYTVWSGMIQRCTNPKSTRYKYYGARGIKVCRRWLKFENFFADMGKAPSPRHTIERIDNDGNYEPGNVRWATQQEQCNNTRRTRFITHNGQTKSLASWAKETGVNRSTLWTRLYELGWSMKEALR